MCIKYITERNSSERNYLRDLTQRLTLFLIFASIYQTFLLFSIFIRTFAPASACL
jgi:hypothetical protein